MIVQDNPDFTFQKKLGIPESMYGTHPVIINAISRLMQCMKETNELHNVSCEFFRLDFRQPYFDEQMQFPVGSLILDLKWGSKKELEEINAKDREL